MLVIQMVSSKVVYKNHMLVGTCRLDLTLDHLFVDHIGFHLLENMWVVMSERCVSMFTLMVLDFSKSSL